MTTHRFQACLFKKNKRDEYQDGIAKLTNGFDFGDCDIEFIMDMNGKRIAKVWTYALSQRPLGAAIEINQYD